ncbi:MAG: OmpH family outer membrane protein [Smithellaceae bacterium]|nr:OmpH family outer membrane protein [Smithellaceae bacterium]
MKRTMFVVVSLFILAVFVLPPSPALASAKIGFVDMREIMVGSEAGRKAADEFKKAFEKERDVIQVREAELKKLKDDLDRQRPVMTESALRERETAYQKKFRDYQTLVRDANEALQARDQELTKILMPEVLKLVNTLGEREKYSMIIDISTIPVPFFSKELDITKRVIEEFNRTYKPAKR